MSELASTAQLRGAFLRWAMFMVPGVVLLGFLSGAFAGSGSGSAWFNALEKPSIYPPPGTFQLAWTIAYVLIGAAGAIVASARGARGRGGAMIVFAIQLVLNLLWSPVFFGQHQITAALILIALLDLAVVVTIVLFWRIRPLAAWLLMPYLLWIGFATLLTWEFRQANPDADGKEVSGAVQRIELAPGS